MVEVKAILDQQALRIGAGKLPDWLRHKKSMRALDTFDDELCLVSLLGDAPRHPCGLLSKVDQATCEAIVCG